MSAVLKEHRATAWMLAFVALFYTAVFIGNLVTNHRLRPQGMKSTEIMKPEEFKQKEEDFKRNILKDPALISGASYVAMIVLALGIFLDSRFLWGRYKRRRWVEDGVPLETVAWGPLHVIGAGVLMFFAEAILLIAETAYFLIAGDKNVPRDFLLIFNSLFRDTLVACVIVWFVTKKLGHRVSVLGLTTKDLFKNIGRGITGYIAVLPPLLVSLIAMAVIVKFFAYEPPPQNVVQIYLKKSSDPYLLFFTLFVAGIGPVIEEIFFRGYTYGALRQKFGVRNGMVLTSLIFAAFHMNLAAFIPIFFLGMFLCYLYEATGSLVPSMIAHMLHNLLMVSFTLGFKQIAG